MTAAPTSSPLHKKLEIADDHVFTVRNAPGHVRELLGDAGGAVWQQSLMPPLDVIVTFHTRRAALDLEWPKIIAPLPPDGAIWIAYPKPNSDVATDLTEDSLKASRLKKGWLDTKVVGIDDMWIAVRFVKKPTQMRPKDNARKKR
ncbi:MAG: hypothetical protein WD023_07915 [Ilumatobacteraceae bacterium]